tara:strand:+ start:12454 stop:15054 length:2601 start_codon:yes stop_codon:yes gene_type:complete
MAIGRITGSVLKSNLTRNGVDLAFETNLLYLDVTNSRVGIGTSEPSTALEVNGTITASAISGLTTLSVDGVTITDNTISTNASNANLELSGNGSGTVSINGIKFPTADGSADRVLKTDGSGQLSFTEISTNSISQANSNVTVTDTGTGAITVAADGGTIITMNATTALDASGVTNAIRLPGGTTGQRPSGAVGEIRYNSTTDTIEGYTSAAGWAQLGATTTTAENTDDTTTGSKTAISTTEAVVNQFTTGSFDSAFYLTITRDEINNQVATQKHSLVHNDTSAFVATYNMVRSDTSTEFVSIDADITGGNARLKATGDSVVNSISFYRIGLGDNTSAGTTGNVTTVINTDVDSAAEQIDSWAKGSYRGAKYYISVNNASKTELMNIEAIVVHDGTTAYITPYGNVNTGNNDLITLTAEIDGSNCVVKAAGNESNLRVTVYRILLSDSESASSGDNVNIIGGTNVSSTATTVDTFNNSTYTGAYYVFTGFRSAGGEASIQEVMVVSNDDAYIAHGPMVSTAGTDQLSFTATQTGSTVTVKAASTSGASTTVNGYRVHMLRGEGGAGTDITVLTTTAQTISGSKTFTDSTELKFGTDADANIKHTGTNLNIQETTGDINIRTYADDSDVVISSDDGSGGLADYIVADGSSGAVKLKHYGTTVFETTSTGASITNTSTSDALLLTTTEDSSTAGPVISLKRNSSSVANADYLGQIKFQGENDADQEVNYAKISGKILDKSDGSEDGIIEFAFLKNGSNNISGRFRSDSLQLLNDTSLRVTGHIEMKVLSGDPSGGTDLAQIYAKDESSSAEVFVQDEAGNVTKISPHNEKGEWEYFSRNTKTGKTVRVNMEEMIKDIEKLTGKKYIKED